MFKKLFGTKSSERSEMPKFLTQDTRPAAPVYNVSLLSDTSKNVMHAVVDAVAEAERLGIEDVAGWVMWKSK